VAHVWPCKVDFLPTLLSYAFGMTPEIIEKYNAKTAGGKYIFNPNKG
jgi:hypothetical protein